MLLQFLVVLIKFTKFVGENVGVRHKVKVLPAVSFLHSDDIEAQPVFPGDLVTLREVVNLLVFIKSLIQVTFATARGPQNVPLMALSWRESGGLKD